MTRARICLEHPGTIIRHHDFENFPDGISPHATAPFDYLIVALAAVLSPFSDRALDLAGAFVSPLIAVVLGIFLCWWTRRIRLRFRFAALIIYGVSPILAHGTALGRPDHQSLLIALIAVAVCADWILLSEPSPAWSFTAGAAWAIALWVSLYEPLLVMGTVMAVHGAKYFWRGPRRDSTDWLKWIVFAAVLLVAIVVERRAPAWPDPRLAWALQNWGATVGELHRVRIPSTLWFEWCGWLVLLTPILFWKRNAPAFLLVLLLVTFALTITQARWSYFFVLFFALVAPALLQSIPNRHLGIALFFVSLWPVAQAWDRSIDHGVDGVREGQELRALSAEVDGAFLAPWWFSPAISYWSNEPGVSGSSHETIAGTVDSARFYATTKPQNASEICVRRRVQWIVSYDADRLAANSSAILDEPVSPDAMCYVLDRHPSRAPAFLQLVAQTARFKLYRVKK